MSGQINRHFLFLTSRQAAEPEDLVLANWRLDRRLVSLSLIATDRVVLVAGWCRVRCRTYLEYGLGFITEAARARTGDDQRSTGD